MQLVFVLVTLLLVAAALFAFQNPDPVTVRFLGWQVSSSVALVTLAAGAAGALIAVLLGFGARLRRWSRARATARVAREPASPGSSPSGTPPAGTL